MLDTHAFQGVLQRQRAVHDGREHTHVVGGNAIHACAGQTGAAELVATADYRRHLRAQRLDVTDLTQAMRLENFRIDAVVGGSEQRLRAG